MVTTAAPPAYTVKQFLRLPDAEQYELVAGELEDIPVSVLSGWVGAELSRRIGNYVAESRSGFVFDSTSGIAIWDEAPDLLQRPDVTFVKRERLTSGLKGGTIRIVPDLVVEVVSPHDRAERLQRKLADYRAAAIPVVWVIYPDTRTAYVHAGDNVTFIPADGVLDGGGVLPGFSLPLADLFAAAGDLI
jgi:Uma2 family endonuclease